MQEANEMRDRLIHEFVENYMQKLFYFCLKKTGSHMKAEDLTQDIALQIITALHKGTIPTSFSAWVWQIARNCYSVWAKEKHKRNESVTGSDISDYEIEDESENILDEMIHTDEMALLQRELAFIKSDYRNIVVAYYIENKSVREIADSLSLSTNTVKSRLLRARQILKEGMDMAREFGKRSYKPEEIVYSNICTAPGELGQPWTLMDPKLNQNIFLACYDNPMTVEELAIEVGVAFPYIEDTVNHLTAQTLLVKNGDKYETNFPIISREAQQKIHFYYEGILPQLIALITENIDRLVAQYEESDLCLYGEYQSYEEAKWMLLMDFYKGMYSLCDNSPKDRLGNTPRPNRGVWDVVGFEKCDFCPESVGHHCQYEGFVHYRFEYCGINSRTPANLSEIEVHELRLMVEGKAPENLSIAEKLVEYGYAYKRANEYIPNVVVIRQNTNQKFLKFCERKNFSAEFMEHANARGILHRSILNTIEKINCTVREILYADLPESVRTNTKMVNALLESICSASHTLGYIVKYALAIGWLKYDENTSPAIGAYFMIP
ncbi:MAG: sigma-70 family RNA polymerase sigma factor [Ruminococcaceae bacterium]|nr:sigma-70 family RNA polymerase sigma factor [Oscillospiraceae bacterium]